MRISCILPSTFKDSVGAEKYTQILNSIDGYDAFKNKSLVLGDPPVSITGESSEGDTRRIIFPLVSVEIPLNADQKISPDIMDTYDVTCLVNKMIKDPKYQTLFNYCFPLPSLLSLVTIYTIEGFVPSLGEEWGAFKNNGGKAGGKALSQFRGWDRETFTQTKKLLRNIFRSNYYIRDIDYKDPESPSFEENARMNLKIKSKLPEYNGKKLPWWMRKMLRPKPVDMCEEE